MTKKIKFLIIISLFFSVINCAGNSGKVEKKLNVVDVKRDGLTEVKKTMENAPNYMSDKTKQPRRALSGSMERLTAPNFSVSINFKRTKISDGLKALGNMAGKNIIISEDVIGYLDMEVIDEPWSEVFNSIIDLNSLSYREQTKGGIIKVFGGGMSSSSGTEAQEIFHVFYNKPTDVKTQIDGLYATATTKPTIVADDANRKIIVTGSKKTFEEIETYLDTVDVKKPQVLIEAFLLEVKPTFQTKLGTRLGLTRQVTSNGGGTVETIRGGIGTSAGALTLGNSDSSATNFLIGGTSGLGILKDFGSKEIKFEIDALEEEGDAKTLSNPKLFTLSGENAVIQQGTRFGVNETTTADGATTTTVKYYDANLTLNVTPTVTGDGHVSLDVTVSNDTVNTTATPPIITKKEVDTNLILADGDIAVVGGILTQTLEEVNARVPGLGKLPVLGALFRSRTQKDDKTELLIFLAPRII